MTKEDRDLNRFLKKRLKTSSIDNENCTSINMPELQQHPDNIAPKFLKSLDPLAVQELLFIFNASFHLADCPWIWRVAIIIPLLIVGKSPSDVTSFWPISLTSYIVKLLECIRSLRSFFTDRWARVQLHNVSSILFEVIRTISSEFICFNEKTRKKKHQ